MLWKQSRKFYDKVFFHEVHLKKNNKKILPPPNFLIVRYNSSLAVIFLVEILSCLCYFKMILSVFVLMALLSPYVSITDLQINKAQVCVHEAMIFLGSGEM